MNIKAALCAVLLVASAHRVHAVDMEHVLGWTTVGMVSQEPIPDLRSLKTFDGLIAENTVVFDGISYHFSNSSFTYEYCLDEEPSNEKQLLARCVCTVLTHIAHHGWTQLSIWDALEEPDLGNRLPYVKEVVRLAYVLAGGTNDDARKLPQEVPNNRLSGG